VILNSPVAVLNENGVVVEDLSINPVKSKRVYDMNLQKAGLFIVAEATKTVYGVVYDIPNSTKLCITFIVGVQSI